MNPGRVQNPRRVKEEIDEEVKRHKALKIVKKFIFILEIRKNQKIRPFYTFYRPTGKWSNHMGVFETI